MKNILIALFVCSVVLVGCNKIKYKNKCCEGELIIETESYNQDSVAIYLPNAFTPNGDGINDLFHAHGWGINPENFEFKIYKKNKLIYETNTINQSWDGKYKNEICKVGIYNYKLQFLTIHNEIVNCKGEVCLIHYPNPKNGFKNCNDCIFGDMLDPITGVNYITGEGIDC